MTPAPPNPPMPPGMRAALLEKGGGRPMMPPVLNEGAVPPVGANDLKIDATHNEVTLTFRMVAGGGAPDNPQTITEVARVVCTWPFLESVFGSTGQILEQALPVRVESLSKQLETLVSMQQTQQAMAEQIAGQQNPDAEPQPFPDEPDED